MGLIALWHVEPLGPGIKPVSPALAGGFLSTEPPGKSHVTPILLTLGKKEMADAKYWGPGEGHGNLLQYSSLENPMDRGAWWATVHGVAKSGTCLK